jgi:CDP-glucose 4,6-dehydratase
VIGLAEAAVKHWGAGAVEVAPQAATGSSGHEAGLLQLNCDKANLQMGWQPRWDLESTFRETVSWYRAHHDQKDMTEYTRRQIHQYMESHL